MQGGIWSTQKFWAGTWCTLCPYVVRFWQPHLRLLLSLTAREQITNKIIDISVKIYPLIHPLGFTMMNMMMMMMMMTMMMMMQLM